MALFVPRQLTLARPPAVQIGVFLTFEQLGGPNVTMHELVVELSKLRRSEVIRVVVAVSARLSSFTPPDHSLQWTLANELFSPDLLAALKKCDKGMEWAWTIFHFRQLLFVLQAAAGACKEETPYVGDQGFAHAMGRVCLMANTILHENEPQQSSEQWTADYNRCFVPSIIRILDHTPRMEFLARAFMLWFEIPKTPKIVTEFRRRKVPSFEDAFVAKYGVSLERFFLLAMSLWCHFQNHTDAKNPAVWVDSDAYLVPYFGKDDVERTMKLLSQTPEMLAESVAKRSNQKWIEDSSMIRAQPIIEFLPGRYACPDIRLLYRFLTEYIFFLLKEAYSNNKFQEVFGHVFEEYTASYIGQFGVASDALARTYWPSPYFVGTNDEACDGILASDEITLVMENKHRLLMLKEKYSGDPELTWRGVKDIVGKPGTDNSRATGIFQLARNITRMFRGEEVHSGPAKFRLNGTTNVIPAIVSYEDAVSLGAVRKWAEDQLRQALERNGIDMARVGPLLIFNAHNIERLEALTHKTGWARLITNFADYVTAHRNDPIATFDVFVSKSDFQSEDPNTSLLAETWEKAMAFAQGKILEREATV